MRSAAAALLRRFPDCVATVTSVVSVRIVADAGTARVSTSSDSPR